jgi:hypothetical protein
MGQYLAMGLAYEMKTSLGELSKEKISNEELRQEIEKTLLYDMNLYDETETGKYLSFTLKDKVFETGLIAFLEALYPMVYNNRNGGEYQGLLKKLRETPSTDWIDLALKKSYRAFRFDTYAESRYIEFAKPFRPGVSINFGCIMLYLGYGKIITEGMSDFLDFFKHCIHETFKEHPIVKSIQVYITG